MRRRADWISPEEDPLDGMAHLFDVAMVFAVALMVALAVFLKAPELLGGGDVTMIRNAGRPDMEIIVKQGQKVKRYQGVAGEISGQGGQRIGVAYRLPNGEVVYVPTEGGGVQTRGKVSEKGKQES